MLQYLLSVHMVAGEPEPSPEQMATMYRDVDTLNKEIMAAGAWVFGGGLNPPDEATVVSFQDGNLCTTVGPRAATGTQLGGFWIITASDLESALVWARQATRACCAPVEVRVFQEEPEV